MEEWAMVADQVGIDALEDALRYVVRNDSSYFPSIDKIRERAGMNKSDHDAVEADAAWDTTLRYIDRYGCDGLPLWREGKQVDPPALPARISYAVRKVGGLYAIYKREIKSEPFMRKEFAEAYKLAPIAELILPQLEASFASHLLESACKALPQANPCPSRENAAARENSPARGIPEHPEKPLTDAEWSTRQEQLQAQKAQLQREVAR